MTNLVEPDEVIDPTRDANGRYADGHTGNAGGRPKLPDAFKARGPAGLALLAKYAEDPSNENHFEALKLMLERIYGKVPAGEQVDADRLTAFFAGVGLRMAAAAQLVAADAAEDGDG